MFVAYFCCCRLRRFSSMNQVVCIEIFHLMYAMCQFISKSWSLLSKKESRKADFVSKFLNILLDLIPVISKSEVSVDGRL